MSAVAEAVLRLRPDAEVVLADLLAEPPGREEQAKAQARRRLEDLLDRDHRARAAQGASLLSEHEQREVAERLLNLYFGLGPLQPYLEDEEIEEIICNGAHQGFVIRAGAIKEEFAPGFADDEELRTFLARLVARAGRRLDESQPAVDARLPDGSRLNAILPPLSPFVAVTIRRHRMVAHDLTALVARDVLTAEAATFLRWAVGGGANILVSGGTGSGKTTTLNALGAAIPEGERVVTIEETAELRLGQAVADCVALQTRPANAEGVGEVGIRELVRHALRMRPSRIIVGEVRGAEAVDMLQAMNSGHQGSMGTIHANDARQAISKLQNYVQMAEDRWSDQVVARVIAETIDLVVHLRWDRTGTKRRVSQILEVTSVEGDRVLANELYGEEEGELAARPVRPRLADRLGDLPRLALVGAPSDRRWS